MGRYFLKYCYRGTLYRGAQKTCDSRIRDEDTIQGAIECALNSLAPKPSIYPTVNLSSRTDVGVHALHTTAHVDLFNQTGRPYVPQHVLRNLNRYLIKSHHDIRIHECIPVTDDFSARYNALSRTYIYRFMIAKNYEEQRLPLMDLPYTFHLRHEDFDIEKVKSGIKLFLGRKDWTTFAKKTEGKKYIRTRRELMYITLTEGKSLMPYDPFSEFFDYWEVTCKGRSFLYNQVRRIVTALLGLGKGFITEKDIITMFQVPNSKHWNTKLHLVPPHGLFLKDVEYDQEELDKCTIHIEDPWADIAMSKEKALMSWSI